MLIKCKQCFIYLKNILILVFNKVFNDCIKFTPTVKCASGSLEKPASFRHQYMGLIPHLHHALLNNNLQSFLTNLFPKNFNQDLSDRISIVSIIIYLIFMILNKLKRHRHQKLLYLLQIPFYSHPDHSNVYKSPPVSPNITIGIENRHTRRRNNSSVKKFCLIEFYRQIYLCLNYAFFKTSC